MFQPCLQRSPQYAKAKVAKCDATEGVDPAKHCRANPATTPAKRGGDTDTPENRADEKADKEKDELHAAYP